jgi:D-alanyl-lipoteichoic acid acyltransferase DltB (MBOAT superfamily)
MNFVSGDAQLAFVARGFEFSLAAHSYLADSRRLQARDLRQCYFFLLVNPVLVFHQFGKRKGPPSAEFRDVLRCVGGVCTIAGYFGLDVLIDRLPFTAESMEIARVRTFDEYMTFVGATGLVAISTYLAHSGTASVQIGAMRMAGYVIPERYNYPFLAATPADWWRRWNTYVGSWFTSYCLLPSTVFFRRKVRLSSTVAGALSILACFFVSGVIHAAASTSARQGTMIVVCFVAQAVLVISWLGASRLGVKLPRLFPAPIGLVVRQVAPLGSWAARVQINMILLSFLFPMLSGGQGIR